MATFNKYRKNVYSQNGEDGITEELCRRLNIVNGFFVEFGAWDGRYSSNTYNLLLQGWRGVYIEGNKKRFRDLESNIGPLGNSVTALNAYVGISGEFSLDSLLAQTVCPPDFELLSIDIDSVDWHVWSSLTEFNPKIVIIEVNSSVPVGVFQVHGAPGLQGSSFTSTVALGKAKGYTPVCHVGNLFFVRDDFLPNVGLTRQELESPDKLFDPSFLHLAKG